MAYKTMKKLIENENLKLINKEIEREEYDMWKESTQNKLDVFLSTNRITTNQYNELVGLLK